MFDQQDSRVKNLLVLVVIIAIIIGILWLVQYKQGSRSPDPVPLRTLSEQETTEIFRQMGTSTLSVEESDTILKELTKNGTVELTEEQKKEIFIQLNK